MSPGWDATRCLAWQRSADYREFCARQRTLRKRRGLSSEDVARHLGVTGPTIISWEAGYRTVSVWFLIKLADFYEVAPSWLLNGPGEMSPATVSTTLRDVADAVDAGALGLGAVAAGGAA